MAPIFEVFIWESYAMKISTYYDRKEGIHLSTISKMMMYMSIKCYKYESYSL